MLTDILSLKAVVSGYGGVRVLHGVDLNVRSARVTAIIGPNGHGKSTLLRTIAGLNATWSGEIKFDGTALTGDASGRARRGLVLVPQGDQLFVDMTVEENLFMGAYSRSDTRGIQASLGEVYDLFPKLKERRSQKTGGLSGGERRMVGIGRGMMANGKLMMIDEPSLGLAPVITEQIYAAMDGLARAGLSIILVEENPQRVARVAHDIHLMDAGQFAWSGTADELTKSSDLVKTYLGG